MRRDVPQLIIMISGVALLVVGIGLIIPQFIVEMLIYRQSKIIDLSTINASRGITLGTHYVGVMVVAIGATLEIIGYISTLPWKNGKNSN